MLELSNVKKFYGHILALDGLSLSVPDGALYGFIGPNGAGKTTAIRIMCGLLRASEGVVSVGGLRMECGSRKLAEKIGYVPDYFGNYGNLRISEYLSFFAECYGIYGMEVRKRVGMMLELSGFLGREDIYVDTLSRGMQQKLSLARALIHEPDLLILDEPTSGLDPRTRYEFKQILSELSGQGKTVLISSHLLSEISEVCTDVGIIDQGRMVLEGNLTEVLEIVNASNPISIVVESGLNHAMRVLREDDCVRSITIRNREMMITYNGNRKMEAQLLARLVESGAMIRSFHREKGSLESLFLQLTGEEKERKVSYYEASSDL